ncbi:hypothetical protein HDV03_003568 [Kappamyces sp. JEL0829]|nr:hypothetical protein HDV03_003568 [Kappamyces sp. JEL0829]
MLSVEEWNEIKNNSKTELWLTFQDLTFHDAIALSQELVKKNSVQKLNLNGNNIGDDGAIALAAALSHCPSLTDLNLAGNNIGDKGAVALAKALEANRNIVSLCLLGNNISDVGAFAMAEMLAKNSYLQHLYLYLNWISDAGALKIAQSTRHHRHLATLWLDHNPVSFQGACAAVNELVHNQSLVNLEMTVQNELMEKSEQLRLKMTMARNTTLAQTRTDSAKELLKRRRALIMTSFPLPVEIQHEILFSAIQGFDAAEKAALSAILLDRCLLGALTSAFPAKSAEHFSGSELVRRCVSLQSACS